MNRRLNGLVAIVIVLGMALAVLPAVGAAGNDPIIQHTDGRWEDYYYEGPPQVYAVDECMEGGYAVFNQVMRVPAGYKVNFHSTEVSESYGTYEQSVQTTAPAAMYHSGDYMMYVPWDGYAEQKWDLYAPNDEWLSSSTIYANCVTGEIRAENTGVYGVFEPPAAARVPLRLVANTPLYSEPNPEAILPDMILRAGQEWFVVGQVVGTDRYWWLEVYTGGANNAYVPASAFGFVQTGPLGDQYETGPLGDQFQTGPWGDQFQTGPFGDEFQTGPFGDQFETGPFGDEFE